MLHSSATVWRSVLTWGELPSKTQAFLCFQTSHFLGTLLIVEPHQPRKREDVVGAAAAMSSCWNSNAHTCRVKTHAVSRCCIVSSSWSNKGQTSWSGNPLLARQSCPASIINNNEEFALQRGPAFPNSTPEGENYTFKKGFISRFAAANPIMLTGNVNYLVPDK